MSAAKVFKLKLPATSANLGPGFDAVALAMSFYLHVEAHVAANFSLLATGRDAESCELVEDNLIIETYKDVLTRRGKTIKPLAIRLRNEIPLGMGCGSSAAALLAGVALADHFGGLKLKSSGILLEASRREGHPDNIAACWLGGFTVSAQNEDEVLTATFMGDPRWRLMLVIPEVSLATKKARALLPERYTKADVVFNVQRSSLLVGAFAQKRLDLLQVAMQDRIHQPYRAQACPLLAKLLPLAGKFDVAGVALSGAGPSVLMVLGPHASKVVVERQVRVAAGKIEILHTSIARGREPERLHPGVFSDMNPYRGISIYY